MVDVVLAPPNTMLRIEKLYAYLSTDEAGNEGLCAGTVGPGGFFMPLIAADQERLQCLTEAAEIIASTHRLKITLVEFTTRVELRVIEGKSS